MLDKYYDVIVDKLKISGITYIGIYKLLVDRYLYKGSYSLLKNYIMKKGLKKEKTKRIHIRYETPPANQVVQAAGIAGYGVISCSDSRFGFSQGSRTDTNQLEVGYFMTDPSIYFRFDSSIATCVDEFKLWLSENPELFILNKNKENEGAVKKPRF